VFRQNHNKLGGTRGACEWLSVRKGSSKMTEGNAVSSQGRKPTKHQHAQKEKKVKGKTKTGKAESQPVEGEEEVKKEKCKRGLKKKCP